MATIEYHPTVMAKTVRKDDPSQLVSNQLRCLIEDSGISRYRLAKLMGVQQSALSRFMSGERGLSMKALDKLGIVLDLEIGPRRRGKETKGQ
jgi:plasmid maintenance system antidote protein VapI